MLKSEKPRQNKVFGHQKIRTKKRREIRAFFSPSTPGLTAPGSSPVFSLFDLLYFYFRQFGELPAANHPGSKARAYVSYLSCSRIAGFSSVEVS